VCKMREAWDKQSDLTKVTLGNILLKGIFGTIITQPLAGLVTISQVTMDALLVDRLALVWERGMFKGLVPSIFRESGKAAYKTPVMLKAQGFVEKQLQQHAPELAGNKIAVNVLAGVLFGSFDATVSVIPDRIATFYKASTAKDQKLTEYLKESSGPLEIWQKLTKGYSVYLSKQIFMCTTLYVAHTFAAEKSKELFPEKKEKQMVVTSLFSSMSVAVASLPLEWAKSLRQKPGAPKDVSTLKLATTAIQEHGWKAPFSGMGPKLLLTTLGYTFNAAALTFYKQATEGNARE